MRFFNSSQKNMCFEDVVSNIKEFIRSNPESKLRLAVGTDSQVKGKFTCFATGIHIHRVGHGAWCCISKKVLDRRIRSIQEKISLETSMTYEIAYKLNTELLDFFCEMSTCYKGFDLRLEAHIDVGTRGESKKLIREMVGYFEGMGIDTKIKPDSYVASSYANRHSKNIS